LLLQDDPDALILAVLGNFGDRKPQEVVTCIVRRLKALLGANERRFCQYMTIPEILSRSRGPKAQDEDAESALAETDIAFKGSGLAIERRELQVRSG
jgi:hypothetical protein